MAALLPILDEDVVDIPAVLTLVRLASLECRADPRQTLQACAIVDPSASAGDFATLLARALPSASDRRFVFWQPGTPELSFDERWLLALVAARRREDRDSEAFLMGRRLRPASWPVIRMLIDGLSQELVEF